MWFLTLDPGPGPGVLVLDSIQSLDLLQVLGQVKVLLDHIQVLVLLDPGPGPGPGPSLISIYISLAL